MATFTLFNDRLPDPTFLVSNAGSVDVSGSSGPGFASVSVTSNRPVQASRTISGRGVMRETGAHYWEININYHPMTRTDFDVISTFLDSRNGRLNPFYVVLPQYSKPKNATFATSVNTNTPTVSGAHAAGSSTLLITHASINFSGTNVPAPGDFININDTNDVNHLKAYRVTRVETNALYQTGTTQPTTTQARIHLMPPLVRSVSAGAQVLFNNPEFRVIQKAETLEYSLGTDNLYQFQLQLEEILP